MILPLYVMRKYENIFVENGYKCIETARNRYVLDYADPSELTYGDRRIELLKENLPYPLYPINYVIRTLDQLVCNPYKLFYTDQGQILKWNKKKFYTIKDYYITSSWQTSRGDFMINVRGCGLFRISRYNGEPIAKIVKYGRDYLFYSTATQKGTSPKRVKL